MKCSSDARFGRASSDRKRRTTRVSFRNIAIACTTFATACSTLPPSAQPPSELEASVRLFGSEVAELRGLRVRQEVPAGIQSESELRSSLQSLVIEEWGEDEMALEAAYKLFGLIPKTMDLKQYLVELYTGQVVGYYDPKRSSFFIKSDTPESRREPDDDGARDDANRQFVIAHEFAHALQDQHFDLEALDERFEGESDRATAMQALIEGDAMLAGLDHLVWRMGLPLSSVSPMGRLGTRLIGRSAASGVGASEDESEQLREAPDVIATNLTFPYVEGMRFASALRTELGQAGLDAAFRDPPDSTEQILYPERYLDRRDFPVKIELAPPPSGWRSSASQTLGMLDLRVLLRTFGENEGAAEGWDGDRFAIWEIDGAEPLLAWVLVWDSPGQARRFESAYARALRTKRGDDRFAVVREDDVVAVVEGADRSDAMFWASGLLESQITRNPRDQPPLGFVRRALRWPASYARLDRAREMSALGGNLFELRLRNRGYSFSLANGLGLRLERTPDRMTASTALGLLWTSSDRLHAYRAGAIPGVLSFQRRGRGQDARSELQLGQTLILPSLVRWTSEPDVTRFSLFGLVQTTFGPEIPRGERVSLLFGLIDLPI